MGCAILPHLKSLVEIIEHGKLFVSILSTVYIWKLYNQWILHKPVFIAVYFTTFQQVIVKYMLKLKYMKITLLLF